jgi:hypothetical protein
MCWGIKSGYFRGPVCPICPWGRFKRGRGGGLWSLIRSVLILL